MLLQRRQFISGIGLMLAAPAVLRVIKPMKIVAPDHLVVSAWDPLVWAGGGKVILPDSAWVGTMFWINQEAEMKTFLRTADGWVLN